MPSPILNALNGLGAAPAAASAAVPAPQAMPAGLGNMLSALNQFRSSFGAVMNAQDPAGAAQAILAQRGFSPEQIQGIMNQYGEQATAIQRQLMGMR